MLHFFRTYQRVFFIVITITIIISFTFFGTYNAAAGSSAVPHVVIGKGIDGSEITKKDFDALCRMIGSSPLDHSQGKVPNLLNDSVVQKDLIASGTGMMLARRYFDELKPDLEMRLATIKRYRPFVHPQAPHVNIEGIWQRFHPVLSQHLAQLKSKSDQLTMETLAVMFQVYLDQAQFPADLVKQMMLYQLNEKGMSGDPLVQNADFSLFGFKSLEDWFGPKFVQLAGQFIWNAALIAEKNGYWVTNEEVRADLYQNIVNGYHELAPREQLSPADLEHYYLSTVFQLGGDEATALNSWRQVMLFRRLFDDVGNSVFLDPLSFQQFQTYTKERVKVDLYELPEALRLKDLRSIFRLQVYVDAVARNPAQLKNNLQLPTRFATLDVLEKRAPELIEQGFEIEFTQINRQDLLRQISLKETWDWEAQEESWEQLKRRFPECSQAKVSNGSERLAVLDQLESKQRLQIDQFAREKILEVNGDRQVAALLMAEPQKWSGGLRAKGGVFPLSGVKNQGELIELLKQAPIQGETASATALAVQAKLNAYPADGNWVYKIAVLKRDSKKEMVSFARALYDGTLDQMLDQRLESAYPDVRKKQAASFQQADGSWRPFTEVKEAVGKIVYADLLRSIEEGYRSLKGELPGTSGNLPSAFYTQHRLLTNVDDAKQEIEQHGDDPRLVRTDAQEGETLETQWQLIKVTRIVERSENIGFSKEKMFALPEFTWSPIEVGHGGVVAFYHVLAKELPKVTVVEGLDNGHQALALDARRRLMGDLLDQMSRKKAIDLSMGEKS